jgi:hypothetical protein
VNNFPLTSTTRNCTGEVAEVSKFVSSKNSWSDPNYPDKICLADPNYPDKICLADPNYPDKICLADPNYP